ncbi:hypothetical protein HK405_006415, partial [Cladochytrium tenue]
MRRTPPQVPRLTPAPSRSWPAAVAAPATPATRSSVCTSAMHSPRTQKSWQPLSPPPHQLLLTQLFPTAPPPTQHAVHAGTRPFRQFGCSAQVRAPESGDSGSFAVERSTTPSKRAKSKPRHAPRPASQGSVPEAGDQVDALFDSLEMNELFRILASPVRVNIAGDHRVASKIDPSYLGNLKKAVLSAPEEDAAELRLMEEEESELQAKMITAASDALLLSPGKSSSSAAVVSDSTTNVPAMEAGHENTKLALRTNIALQDIIRVVEINAILKRPGRAQEAFDMIPQLTSAPPTLTAYNTLIDAYAGVGDISNAARVFRDLRTSDIQPDVVSYSSLIKACVGGGDVAGAFKVYNVMKKRGVAPDLPIYTTLVKGCIRSGDLQRAWKTFEHVQSEVCAPDTVLYTLMLRACATGGEAERALNLFQEMVDKGCVPTEVTYTSLIQACGSRPDYYHEAWALLEQMRRDGFALSRRTFNVLLRVAAVGADLARGRAVWNEMQAAPARLAPDYFSFLAAFKLLDRAKSAVRAVKRQRKVAAAMGAEVDEPAKDPFKTTPLLSGSLQGDPETSESHAAASKDSGALMPVVDDEQLQPDGQLDMLGLQPLILSSDELTVRSIFNDIESIWEFLVQLDEKFFEPDGSPRDLDDESGILPHFGYLDPALVPRVDSNTVDAYLQALCAHDGHMAIGRRAVDVFNTLYYDDPPAAGAGVPGGQPTPAPESINATQNEVATTATSSGTAAVPGESDSSTATTSAAIVPSDHASLTRLRCPRKVHRTGNTFKRVLGLVSRDRALMREHGESIWTRFLRWDEVREARLASASGTSRMTMEELEAARAKERRDRADVKQCFVFMINGRARLGDLDVALDLLDESARFRAPFYLPAIEFRDVPALVERARDAAEAGELGPARRLQRLCPAPASAVSAAAARRAEQEEAEGEGAREAILGVEAEMMA